MFCDRLILSLVQNEEMRKDGLIMGNGSGIKEKDEQDFRAYVKE